MDGTSRKRAVMPLPRDPYDARHASIRPLKRDVLIGLGQVLCTRKSTVPQIGGNTPSAAPGFHWQLRETGPSDRPRSRVTYPF